MRDPVTSVEYDSFYQWEQMFTSHIAELTDGGRDALLTYDAYRSHLSLRVQHY